MVKLTLIRKLPRYNIAHGLVTAAQNAPGARKGFEGLPWREAASLIMVSPSPPQDNGGSGGKPNFLVTKRSQHSGAFSNILCFPGGNSCLADGHSDWLDKFGNTSGFNITEKDLSFIKTAGEIPAIYAAVSKQTDEYSKDPFNTEVPIWKKIPKAVSLRITAIRETFEETGILLCKPINYKEMIKAGIGKDSTLGVGYEANAYTFEDPETLTSWQSKIRKNPEAFLELCEKLFLIPDINALVEWNNWLTPNCFGMQRYDTIFYMALVDQPYPMYICPAEVESASWLTADTVLKDCEEKKSKMITPQIYELSRLKTASMSVLNQLMKIRLSLGIGRWCPAYIRAKDGYLSVFPGDDLYPGDIKIHEYEPIRSMEATLDELRTTSFRQHRIEYRSEFDFKIVIKNYKERAGHIYLD